MAIRLNIPADVECELRAALGGDLDRAALEALVLESYRSRRIGVGLVRRVLGLATRWDAERWLGEHGAEMSYSIEDLEADRRTLDRLLGKAG
jgi:hypothetical protein